jgi:hypothetical protein
LADDERIAADIQERQVRPAIGVIEDPEIHDAPGDRRRNGVVVLRPDPDEHHEPPPDLADHLAVDADTGSLRADPLEQAAHAIRSRAA